MKPLVALDFDTLVELYYQRVFAFAVRLCGRLEQALQLTQHTFCQALSCQSYLGGIQQAESWLFNLLFREFLKERQNDNEPMRSNTALRPGSARNSSPVFKALARIRKEYAVPLVLFYARDLSLSQIADYLGVSVAAVLTLLSKGREELSIVLQPLGTKRPRSLMPESTRRRRRESLRVAA
jgi:RNA polymerase sigma-70 factor (ECF subfamily)